MDAVDGLSGHVYRALEAEGHVRAPQVVIDGLGQGNDVQPLLAQEVGGLVGAVAAQDHQAVQLELVVGLLHGGHLVHAVVPGDLDGLEGGAAGAQEGAALGEDAGEVRVGEQPEAAVDQALVAVLKAVDLHLLPRVQQRLGDAPHGRVQGLTVPAAGQHTDSLHDKPSFNPSEAARRDGPRFALCRFDYRPFFSGAQDKMRREAAKISPYFLTLL